VAQRGMRSRLTVRALGMKTMLLDRPSGTCIGRIVNVPPGGFAYFANVIGNPRGFCFSFLGDTFSQTDLLKPFMPFVAAYVLWQSFAQTTWHRLLFLLVAIVYRDREKLL
jgi:hypothetical protein